MTSAAAETNFSTFYQDLKATEKADSVLTSKQQIERLLRPGCTYRNLNPYEVLQIDPELPIEDVRKKYRRLSILVHPDKNQDDLERSQAAFDAVKKSYALLDDDNTRKKCFEIVEEARGRTGQNMQEKRKKMQKDAKAKGLPPTGDHMKIDEDDPIKYKHAVHILTMKLFADLERKRRQMENKISEDAGRKRETELAAEEKRSVEKEFNKNWEETRQGRVNSWLDFKHGKTIILPPDEYQQQQQQQQQQLQQQLQQQQQQQQQLQTSQMSASTSVPTPEAATAPVEKKKKKKEKRFNPMGFRPPKHKPESR